MVNIRICFKNINGFIWLNFYNSIFPDPRVSIKVWLLFYKTVGLFKNGRGIEIDKISLWLYLTYMDPSKHVWAINQSK